MKNGKLAESVLKRSVLKQLHSGRKGAGIWADCALFSAPNGQILAWCAQEAAVAVQADSGEVELLFQKVANNLATVGAKPVSAQITLMLPLDTEEPQVKEIMKHVAEAGEKTGMEIVGGDTNVSFAVKMPIMTVVGVGTMDEKRQGKLTGAKAGQDIVISKWIGLEGTTILAKKYEEKLRKRYPAFLVETAKGFDQYLSVWDEAQIALENNVTQMHDMSQGGILGALWELAEGAGLGLEVELKRIPIRQETVEVCEVCGVNPYEMNGSGSMLMTSDDGEGLVAVLERAGISASVVGKLTDKQDRIIRNEEEVRFLDRPRGVDPIAELLYGQTGQA